MNSIFIIYDAIFKVAVSIFFIALSGFKDVVLINACYGLGELLVQGSISPDEYLVFKPTMAVIEKKIGTKKQSMVYSGPNEKGLVKIKDVSTLKRNNFCLSEDQVQKVAEMVIKIEQHYSKKMNRWFLECDAI